MHVQVRCFAPLAQPDETGGGDCDEAEATCGAGVIRLNEPEPYPASIFTDAGIAHYELYFDGAHSCARMLQAPRGWQQV